MKSKNKIPFCPVCGKVDFVKILHNHFEIWICYVCKIQFSFLPYSPGWMSMNPATGPAIMSHLTIDPAEFSLDLTRKSVINPARRILIEQNAGKIKLTSDIDSFNHLLASKDLLSLLPDSLGDKNCTQSGEIDLDNKTINSVEY